MARLPLRPERRARIVNAYAALSHGTPKTEEIIRYVRRDCGYRSVSEFLDKAHVVQVHQLERMLDV